MIANIIWDAHIWWENLYLHVLSIFVDPAADIQLHNIL